MDCAEKNKHRLQIAGKLGQGAFGCVYKGTYDGSPCAIKTVSVALDKEDSAHRQFLREAHILQSCDHRCIIKFKALCRVGQPKQAHNGRGTGGRWALVLEYAKDGTLSKKVSRQMAAPGSKVYSNAQALRWALDIASALEYLHMRSPAVFHRDVKLSNILCMKDECGQSVAKLSDFGLHVVADSSRKKLLRITDSNGGYSHQQPPAPVPQQQPMALAIHSSGAASPFAAANVQEAQEGLAVVASGANPSSCTMSLDKDSAWQKQGKQPAAVSLPADDLDYSELHESCGRMTAFVNGRSGASFSAHNLQQQAQQQQHGPEGAELQLRRALSAQSAVIAPTSAERDGLLKQQQVFQRAAHHPGPLSVARVPSVTTGSAGGAGAGAGAASRVAALRAAVLASNMGSCTQPNRQHDWEGGSVCSMATDATWISEGIARSSSLASSVDGSITAEDGSSCGSDWDWGLFNDLTEAVFEMTGQTGSAMYTAPEVTLGLPYNEKADVFSFGVLLYELTARCLLVFTELPTHTTDPSEPDRYAAKVAQGYRPSRPKKMPQELWDLVAACWQQDPIQRPHITEVGAGQQGQGPTGIMQSSAPAGLH
eukprot:gene6929-7147_t